MDSINTMKGYGKVLPHLEDQNHHKRPPNRSKILILIIPTIILATVIICVVATILFHATTSKTKSNLAATKSNSITTLCSVTNHPKSCISSLQSSTTSDPEKLFHLSLQLSLRQFTNLSSLPQKLMVKVNDERVKSALVDCEGLFSDAADGVKSSVSSMSVGKGEEMLSVAKINDIKTWLSAALTNLETCLDGLDEMSSGLHQEMETGMKDCKEYTSNSLAIANKIQSVLDQLHISMH